MITMKLVRSKFHSGIDRGTNFYTRWLRAVWPKKREQADGYFGWCPKCKNNDGYLNIGREHWFLCKEHKVKWCVGYNLFSSWQHETEDEQRSIYDELDFGTFEKIEPANPSDLEMWASDCARKLSVKLQWLKCKLGFYPPGDDDIPF
jgi:hypothetical protein